MTREPMAPTARIADERPASSVPPVLVLGLGNDILSDDAAGLHIVRRVAALSAGSARLAVRESMEAGLALLDEIVGVDQLVLVDAIVTGRAPPGFLHELTGEELAPSRSGAPHFLGLIDTLRLGRVLGLAMPRTVRIFAIEVADPFTVGVGLSPAVAAAVEAAAKKIMATAQARHTDAPGRGRAEG